MSAVNVISFKKNEVIFSEGDIPGSMYIILSGKVEVYKTGRIYEKLHIAELGPGDILGEMSLISGFPRSATAVALSEVNAKVMTKKIFSDSVSGIPSWALCIARVLIKRLRHMNSMIRNLSVEHMGKNGKLNLSLSGKFSIRYDASLNPETIYLKGYFFSGEISKLDEVIRKVIQTQKRVVLDFSNVIDIDSHVVKYLNEITGYITKAGIEFSINNVQLIHDKINTFTGFNDTVSSMHPARRHVMVGDLLITQGGRDKNMYIVKQGLFEVFKTVGEKEIVLAEVGAGDVVGEMSFVAGDVRSASVKAVKPGIVYMIGERDLIDNKYNIPEWFLKIIHQLIHRVRKANNALAGVLNRPQQSLRSNCCFNRGGVTHKKRPRKDEQIFKFEGKSCMVRICETSPARDKELYKTLVGLLNNGFKDILLDFAGVTDIDPDLISLLNKIAASLKAREGKLRFCNVNQRIKTLLKEGNYFFELQVVEKKAAFSFIDKSYDCAGEVIGGKVPA